MSRTMESKSCATAVFLRFLTILVVFMAGCSTSAVGPQTPHPPLKEPLAVRIGYSLWMIDVDTDTIIGPISLRDVHDLKGSMSGEVLATSQKVYICNFTISSETMVGHTVSVLDWKTWEVLEEFDVHAPYDLTMASNGYLYLLGHPNGDTSEITVIDPINDKEVTRVSCEQPGNWGAVAASLGNHIYAASLYGVCQIDIRTNTVVNEPYISEEKIYGLASVSDTSLYLLNRNNVTILDTATWDATGRIDLEGGTLQDIAVASTRKAYISQRSVDGKECSVLAVDIENNKVIRRIQIAGSCDSVAVVDGKAYVLNRQQKTVSIIEIDTDTIIASILLPGSDD